MVLCTFHPRRYEQAAVSLSGMTRHQDPPAPTTKQQRQQQQQESTTPITPLMRRRVSLIVDDGPPSMEARIVSSDSMTRGGSIGLEAVAELDCEGERQQQHEAAAAGWRRLRSTCSMSRIGDGGGGGAGYDGYGDGGGGHGHGHGHGSGELPRAGLLCIDLSAAALSKVADSATLLPKVMPPPLSKGASLTIADDPFLHGDVAR